MPDDQLKQAWKDYVTIGKVPSIDIPESILASWERCRKLGIDPFQKRVKQVIRGSKFEALLNENSNLIDIAMPMMEHLYQFVQGSGFVIALADANGVLLKIIGDHPKRDEIQQGNFIEGALWSEKCAGTNAIGTALITRAPQQVASYEHYCLCSQHSSCSCAPIFDHNYKLVGAINMSGDSGMVHPHTLGMMVAAAYSLQSMLVAQHSQAECLMANQFKSALIDCMNQGIIAINASGKVTLSNSHASRLLGFREGSKVLGNDIHKLLPPGNEPFYDVVDNHRYIADEVIPLRTVKGRSQFALTSRPIVNKDRSISETLLVIDELKRAKSITHRMAGMQAHITFDDLVGESLRFKNAVETGKVIALNDSNVLLLGESGTGKDVFAQAIHNASPRKSGPFVAINCGAIPAELIGSELFGYTEGAFTGAKKGGNPGKFELADGGTIFLDEIGEMPFALQAVLLRVIEERKLIRIGGKEEISLNVRIIAATNKHLLEQADKGHFRKDLFYRLNVMGIRLAPLRKRKEDIPLLAETFYLRHMTSQGKPPQPIPEQFTAALMRYDWPGNIRELNNVIERNVVLSPDGVLSVRYFEDESSEEPAAPAPAPVLDEPRMYRENAPSGNLKDVERQLILSLLKTHDGNMSAVAANMGISRTTLYRKLERYGIKKHTTLS